MKKLFDEIFIEGDADNPDFCRIWFPLDYASCLIDMTIGINSLYCFLRIKGIFDKRNHPTNSSMLKAYIKKLDRISGDILPNSVKWKASNIYFSGLGIKIIQEEIRSIRKNGGCI